MIIIPTEEFTKTWRLVSCHSRSSAFGLKLQQRERKQANKKERKLRKKQVLSRKWFISARRGKTSLRVIIWCRRMWEASKRTTVLCLHFCSSVPAGFLLYSVPSLRFPLGFHNTWIALIKTCPVGCVRCETPANLSHPVAATFLKVGLFTASFPIYSWNEAFAIFSLVSKHCMEQAGHCLQKVLSRNVLATLPSTQSESLIKQCFKYSDPCGFLL